MVKKYNKLLIIVPAYNEESNIISTIEDIKKNASFADYIIINDGSKDKTADICNKKHYNILTLPINLGLAGAFGTGVLYASKNKYDYILQFDADGQHSAKYIKTMLKTAYENNADIVLGSRFVSSKRPKSLRMLGSMLITFFIKLTTGKSISDPTSGMRLYNKKAIDALMQNYDLPPEPDTIAYLIKSKFKVLEIEVEMRERQSGQSYLTLSKSFIYMLRLCVSILFLNFFRKKA